MTRSDQRFRNGLATLAAVTVMAVAGCGTPGEGTISLASYGKTSAEKSIAATVAGMPGAVDRVALARRLDQAKSGSKTRRYPVAWRPTQGGVR